MAKKTISMRKNSQGDSAAVLEEELQKVEPTEEYSVSDDASDNLDFFENDRSFEDEKFSENVDETEKSDVSADDKSQKEAEKKSAAKESVAGQLGAAMKRGVIIENPVLRLVLGTCPTLATTTAASNAIGMGIAATLVLICSNTVISLLRHVIPDKVRIPAYITVIASFVSIVQMLVKAFAPALDESLGIYLPLIVVNCIILGRAEMYASKHAPSLSALDGLAMGVGFTTALLCMGTIREVLGAGSLFGAKLPILSGQPILFFSLAPGGFFVFGLLIAAANKLSKKNNLPVRNGCGDCPAAATCSLSGKGGCRS